MNRRTPLTPDQRILRHTVTQGALILMAGTTCYIACLATMFASSGAQNFGTARGAEVPPVEPTTVLALMAAALAIGAFGRQPRTTSPFERLTCCIDAGAAQLTAIVVTSVAVAALVHSVVSAATLQVQDLAIGCVALSAYLAWRVSCNHLRVERDRRDQSRARWRRQRAKLDRLGRRYVADRRDIVITLGWGLLACATILAQVLTTIRLVATYRIDLGSDAATALLISVGMIAAASALRVLYQLADVLDASVTRHLTVAIACAVPAATTVGTVSATCHDPATLVVGLALLLSTFLPPAALFLVRPCGADSVSALTLRIVRVYVVRHAELQERLFAAFDAVPD